MTTRYLYLDVLKSLAIFAVVLLHQSGTDVRNMDLDNYSWMASNIYFSISHFGVPLFVMISGALLLSPTKSYDIWTWYKKAFLRIVLPLFIWSAIYYIYRTPFDLLSFNVFLIKFLTDKISGHFWFLYMILGIYLSVPFIQAALKNIDNKTLGILLLVWFAIYIISPMTNYFFNIKINIQAYILSLYIGYFLLGYLLHSLEITYKTNLMFILLLIISILITVIGTYFLKISSGKLINILWLNNSLPIFLIASSIFIIIKYNFLHMTDINKWWKKLIISISISSYGIYLIHIIVRNYSNSELKMSFLSDDPYLYIFGMSFIIIAISYLLILLIKKLPYIGNYIG